MDDLIGQNAIKIFEPQEVRYDRPVPYIVSFSPVGVLVIGWSKPMKPVDTNMVDISEMQVVVKPDILLDF